MVTITSAGARRQRRETSRARSSPRESARGPSEMPHAGTWLAQKHPDQLVVAAAAAKAAGQVGNGDLEDRARVIRQPARQARIDADAAPGARLLGERARSLRVRRRAATSTSRGRAYRGALRVEHLGRSAVDSPVGKQLTSASAAAAVASPRVTSSAATPSRPILSSLSSATSASP